MLIIHTLRSWRILCSYSIRKASSTIRHNTLVLLMGRSACDQGNRGITTILSGLITSLISLPMMHSIDRRACVVEDSPNQQSPAPIIIQLIDDLHQRTTSRLRKKKLSGIRIDGHLSVPFTAISRIGEGACWTESFLHSNGLDPVYTYRCGNYGSRHLSDRTYSPTIDSAA